MPRQLLFSRIPVELSVVEFDLDAGEEIFLTYTWERGQGPDIQRTGKGPPYMDLIGGFPGQLTTHPFGLRLGSWLIGNQMRASESADAHRVLGAARSGGAPQEDMSVLQQTIAELPAISTHEEVFTQTFPSYQVLGQQGCGDLTMNAWNVAYVNNALARDPQCAKQIPFLVCLPHEPLEYRAYSCLVKWKVSGSGKQRVTIEEVRFHRRDQVGGDTSKMVWVRYGDQWLPRGEQIELAVSNQQVIRDGELVPIIAICHQFGDLRHILRMPNLNPEEPLYPGEHSKPSAGYRPRQLFGKDQFGDIWLGEEALLDDPTGNLLRAALAGPVFVDFPSGAGERLLRGALTQAGYREVASALDPLAPGDWRFVRRSPQVTVVELHFLRNTYSWTMLGLSRDNRRLLSLACAGTPGRTGYTLQQAADFLRTAGAHNALLIDEGADVFQRVGDTNGNLTDLVPRLRRRMRATFLFARRVGGQEAENPEEDPYGREERVPSAEAKPDDPGRTT